MSENTTTTTTTNSTYDRLIFTDTEYLASVRAFGERTNQIEKLDEIFASLQRIATNYKQRVWIHKDFATYSFYFEMYPEMFEKRPDDWRKHRFMNGGVIYHGELEDGSHPQTFSVTLTPQSSWSIHT